MLIIEGEELICGPRFRATGSELSHSERRKALKEARKELRRMGKSERPERAEPDRKRRIGTGRTDALSTHHAIKFARGAFQHREFLEFEQLGRAEIEAAATTDNVPNAPLDAGSLLDFPVLDINELGKTVWLGHHGKLRANRLGWPREACEGYFLTLFAYLRPNVAPAIFIARRLRDEYTCWQHLPLSERGGAFARWIFRCPVRSTPVEKLYFRAGIFASRQAQRLNYPRQQARLSEE